MSINVTLITGLPGSGKSHWLDTNVRYLVGEQNSLIFDDISQTDPELKQLKIALNDKNTQNIYIGDVNLLEQDMLLIAQKKIQELTKETLIFKRIIFLGNVEICTSNVKLRNDGRNVSGTLKRFEKNIEKIYEKWQGDIDTNFIIVKDYQLSKPKAKI